MTTPLWTPGKARAGQTTLELFSSSMSSRIGKPLQNYDELRRCSVTNIPEFWSALRDFTKVSGDKGDGPVLRDAGKMLGALLAHRTSPEACCTGRPLRSPISPKAEAAQSPGTGSASCAHLKWTSANFSLYTSL
jgi:hypothetical protein